MNTVLETPSTVNELEKWIDAQVTDPLHPEMVTTCKFFRVALPSLSFGGFTMVSLHLA